MTSPQDGIQSNDANCLSNRITIDKISLNLLKAAQRSCARKLERKALDRRAQAEQRDLKNIDLGEVKGRAHAIALRRLAKNSIIYL